MSVAIGKCPYCNKPIYEPFVDHLDYCSEYKTKVKRYVSKRDYQRRQEEVQDTGMRSSG